MDASIVNIMAAQKKSPRKRGLKEEGPPVVSPVTHSGPAALIVVKAIAYRQGHLPPLAAAQPLEPQMTIPTVYAVATRIAPSDAVKVAEQAKAAPTKKRNPTKR